MRLYFLRHATASKGTRQDAQRKLTRIGRAEARTAGAALEKLGCKPAAIFSSPLVRAEQTARLAADEFRPKVGVKIVPQLKNGANTKSLLAVLRKLRSTDEAILVGHAPGLSEHMAELLGAEQGASLPLGKGAIACLELSALRAGAGQLRWLMRAKQLRLIAKS